MEPDTYYIKLLEGAGNGCDFTIYKVVVDPDEIIRDVPIHKFENGIWSSLDHQFTEWSTTDYEEHPYQRWLDSWGLSDDVPDDEDEISILTYDELFLEML